MKHLLDCPLAITSSGTVVASVTHVSEAKNAREALNAALKTGRRVLIAVEFDRTESEEVRLKLDDAAAQTVTTVHRERG